MTKRPRTAKVRAQKAQEQRRPRPKDREANAGGATQAHHPVPTVASSAELVRAAGQQLPPGQRQTLIAQLGRQHGNQQLQRVAASLSGGTLVQREEDEQADEADTEYERIASPVSVTIVLGEPAQLSETVTIDTYADLGNAYEELATVMFLDASRLMPDKDDNEFWGSWEKHYADAEAYRDWYYDGVDQGDRPFGSEIKDLKRLVRQAKNTGQDGHRAFTRTSDRTRKEAAAVRDEAERSLKAAKNLQRMEFLGGEPGTDQTANTVWSVIDKLAGLVNIAGSLAEDVHAVFKVASDLLPKAVSLANLVANWSTTSPAMFGTAFEGLAPLNNVVALGNAAHGYVGTPFTIVAEYIGPMLSAVTALLGKLQIRMIERNDEWTEQFGTPVYVGAEPGGEKMWNYMVRTMRAPSADDVPRPSGEVLEYFDEFRDRFGEFTSAIVPTEGMVLQNIDIDGFMTWLFNHRKKVWISLYGARDPQKAKMVF